MPNPFDAETAPSGPQAPAWDVVVATKSDTVDLATPARQFYATVDGNVRVTTAAGNVRTIPVLAGAQIPVVITRVHSTGTTVTDVVVLFS